MAKLRAISEAEWGVMRVLWEREGAWLGAGEVIGARWRGSRGVHHPDGADVVAAAGEEGGGGDACRRRVAGGGYLYRAKVGAGRRVVREESKSFLARGCLMGMQQRRRWCIF